MPLVSKTFSEIITFTRASTATYYNAAGALTSAAIDEPRLDYNPSTLAAQGLLIEESRANRLLQSADFTTTWGQVNITTTANTTASPDGGTNGDTLLINSAGASTGQISQSFTAGSTITVSVFAKKNASDFLRVELGNLCSCWFNLNTGATASNNAGSGNVLFSSKSIQAISGGWYRCVLTVTTTTITTLLASLYATNTDGVTSSVSSSIFLWGAQLEVGAFATSYIPTTTIALTRAADVASVNTLSPWYNASEGTLYCESVSNASSVDSTNLALSDGTNNNRIQFGTGAANTVWNPFVVVSGSSVATLTQSASFSPKTSAKLALAYKFDDFAATTAGASPVTDTSGAVPTLNILRIGASGSGVVTWNSWIRRVTYYPRKLSSAELQAITA